jgi:hypothetical protein
MKDRLDPSKVLTSFRDMSSAPLDGTAVRLKLKDGFGEYPFEPCSFVRNKWRNAKSDRPIKAEIVGWAPLHKRYT